MVITQLRFSLFKTTQFVNGYRRKIACVSAQIMLFCSSAIPTLNKFILSYLTDFSLAGSRAGADVSLPRDPVQGPGLHAAASLFYQSLPAPPCADRHQHHIQCTSQ